MELATALSEAESRDAVFAAAARAAERCIGHRLFTIMAFDSVRMEVERLYSSKPEAYPPGGRKKKRDTYWGRQVLELGEPYVGCTADDIRANFSDHEVILGLGLESILNMPIRAEGKTLGTVNLLHERGYYCEKDLEAATLLAGLLVAPLSVRRLKLR